MRPCLLLVIPAVAGPIMINAQTLDWAHAIGGNSADRTFSVAVDDAGNVLSVGTFSLSMDLDPGPGVFTVSSVSDLDVFIRKVDAAGNFLWGGSFGSVSFDEARSVTTDANNNVVVTGLFRGSVDVDLGAGVSTLTTGVSTDAFVVKYAANGTLLWARQLGGTSADEGRAVAVDDAGNVLVTGFFSGTVDLDPGPGVQTTATTGFQDVFVLKLDPAGNLLWAHGIGGAGTDIGNGIATDPSGAVFVTGQFQGTVGFDPGPGTAALSSAGDLDMFVLKLTSGGALDWAGRIGGALFDRANRMATDLSGACYITGDLEGDIDVDPGPATVTITPVGSMDGVLVKLDGSGVFQWAVHLAGTGITLETCDDVAVDPAGHVHITGRVGSPMDIDPGPGSTVLTSVASTDIFAASYTATGSLRWGFAVGGGSIDHGRAIAVGPSAEVVVGGEFNTSVDMDPGTGTTTITGPGQHGFVAKYAQPGCRQGLLALKVLLEGPYDIGTGLMADPLRALGHLPLQEPYTAMGHTPSGALTTTPGVLAVTGPDAIVDWVLVELRDPVLPATVVDARSALLQRDGDVVDVDGTSPVLFCDQDDVPYKLAVRHRNHLGVMTAADHVLSGTPLSIDLGLGTTAVFGTDARHAVGGAELLWQGNVRYDGVVKYTGTNNDRDPILVRIGGFVPTAILNGYWPEDVNMDGTVKYAGAGNDRDRVLLTIGGSVPTATRAQQLP
ncbi:MAG: SBBP repeat-containing protein [Flavobacteriales bacterium]|nr:SBBP repeat-containing protein [Flavobacteriales bacterium]